ncbi:hypothetical protein [Microbacterium sp. BH-3-3-3]|uniref:hypothetical protein n=1 Tax=Microbacterium sp. BH-3-3-3 TaxID=1906742 RepID=UPI001642642B|nr:hypothetical protein [Microbacterium sp. BH-3-3-3]
MISRNAGHLDGPRRAAAPQPGGAAARRWGRQRAATVARIGRTTPGGAASTRDGLSAA